MSPELVQTLLYIVLSLLGWEGGKFGIKKIKERVSSDVDSYSPEVCKLKHERIDEKLTEIYTLLEEITKKIDENAEHIHQLSLAQEKLLSVEGPVAKLVDKATKGEKVVVSAL